MNRQSRYLLTNRDTTATALVIIGIEEFGVDFLEWLPSVREEELQKLGQSNVPRANLDKIEGLILSMTTDRFWNEPKIFIYVCHALSNEGPVQFRSLDEPDVDEMSWAVTEVSLNNPASPGEEMEDRFSNTVRKVIEILLLDQGYLHPPSVFDFVSRRDFSQELTGQEPEMYEAMWAIQESKSENTDQFVGKRLKQLIDEVTSLKLKRGDAKKIRGLADRAQAAI